MNFSTILFLFSFAFSAVRSQAQDPEAIWSTLTPSKNLTWSPCYDTFQCTRFESPLDWTHPSDSTVAVAVIRLPSTLSPTDKRYRGPILFNPGGPGVSGVESILGLASSFQKVIGEEYDIVSFDPRGVGRTTPSLRAFMDTDELMSFSIRVQDDPPFGTAPGALARTYAHYKAFGQIAEGRVSNIAPYVSTPQVARDMLAITAAAGFPKLKYWGISYGTILGMTFATMFPDKVERLVIDGVADAEDYYSSKWSTNLLTIDKGMEMFADSCAQAGPEKCALHESTGEAVLARIEKIYDSLKEAPVPVVTGNGSADYGIIDYGMVRNAVHGFLYQPFSIPAQSMAAIFAGLEKGDGSLFWANQIDPRNFLQCTNDSSVRQDSGGFSFLGTAAIGCSDADPVNDTVPMLNQWFEDNKKQSSFADIWPYRVICAGWKTRAVEKFKGNVGANTSFPIMFIGNTADPVTPLRNAQVMSKLFPKSSVLAVDTPGHTSIASPSTCVSLAIGAYFNNGTLPQSGTVCKPDVGLFGEAASNSTAHTRRDGFAAAIKHITQNAKVPRLGKF